MDIRFCAILILRVAVLLLLVSMSIGLVASKPSISSNETVPGLEMTTLMEPIDRLRMLSVSNKSMGVCGADVMDEDESNPDCE